MYFFRISVISVFSWDNVSFIFAIKEGLQSGLPRLGMGTGVCDDDKVIRVTDEEARGQGRSLAKCGILGILGTIRTFRFLVLPLLGNPFVHYVQVDICQQWTDKPALRCSFLVYLAFIHNPGPHHGLDDLQHPPVPYAHMIEAL